MDDLLDSALTLCTKQTNGYPTTITSRKQANWMLSNQKLFKKNLRADEWIIIRLNGCVFLVSGDWLHALQSDFLQLCLSNNDFRTACIHRLWSIVSSAFHCVWNLIRHLYSQHPLICNKMKSRWHAFSMAGIPSTLEPVGLLRSDGRRLDGISITLQIRGKSLTMDYTISNRLTASNSRLAGFESATVADEAKKTRKGIITKTFRT